MKNQIKILTPIIGEGGRQFNSGDEAAFLETEAGKDKKNLQRLSAMGCIKLPARRPARKRKPAKK